MSGGHLLLHLLPGVVGGHQVRELLLLVLEVVVEVLLVAKVEGLGHHWVFGKLLVNTVHGHSKNLRHKKVVEPKTFSGCKIFVACLKSKVETQKLTWLTCKCSGKALGCIGLIIVATIGGVLALLTDVNEAQISK